MFFVSADCGRDPLAISIRCSNENIFIGEIISFAGPMSVRLKVFFQNVLPLLTPCFIPSSNKFSLSLLMFIDPLSNFFIFCICRTFSAIPNCVWMPDAWCTREVILHATSKWSVLLVCQGSSLHHKPNPQFWLFCIKIWPNSKNLCCFACRRHFLRSFGFSLP